MAQRLHAIPRAPSRPTRPRESNPALLSVEETARRLGVGLHTVRTWIADGSLSSTVVGISGRGRRVPACIGHQPMPNACVVCPDCGAPLLDDNHAPESAVVPKEAT